MQMDVRFPTRKSSEGSNEDAAELLKQQWRSQLEPKKDKIEANSSHGLDLQKMCDRLTAPSLSFDWEEPESDEDHRPAARPAGPAGILQVELPASAKTSEGRRALLREEIKRSLSFKQAKELTKVKSLPSSGDFVRAAATPTKAKKRKVGPQIATEPDLPSSTPKEEASSEVQPAQEAGLSSDAVTDPPKPSASSSDMSPTGPDGSGVQKGVDEAPPFALEISPTLPFEPVEGPRDEEPKDPDPGCDISPTLPFDIDASALQEACNTAPAVAEEPAMQTEEVVAEAPAPMEEEPEAVTLSQEVTSQEDLSFGRPKRTGPKKRSILMGSVRAESGLKFPVLDPGGIDLQTRAHLLNMKSHSRPEQVFQAISKVIVEAQAFGIIASPAPIVGRIHQEMGLGMTKLQSAMMLGGATGKPQRPGPSGPYPQLRAPQTSTTLLPSQFRAMGGDGGQVIDRATMVKTKGWGLTKGSGDRYANSLGEMNSYMQMVFEETYKRSVFKTYETRFLKDYAVQALKTLRLVHPASGPEALREPVVACRLGNLYNKEAVISALLNRKMPSDLSHIRGLKERKMCLITWKEDEKEDGRKRIVCPLSREDLDTGSARAVVIWPSGAVVSAKSLKEMKMKECPVTSKAFDNEKELSDEWTRLRERLPTKKRKAQAAAPEAEEEDLQRAPSGSPAWFGPYGVKDLEAESKEKKAKPEKDSSKDSEDTMGSLEVTLQGAGCAVRPDEEHPTTSAAGMCAGRRDPRTGFEMRLGDPEGMNHGPLRVFTGNAHPKLANSIAQKIGIDLGNATVGRFPCGEVNVVLNESVRDCDVFVIQPTCNGGAGPQEHLVELLIMLDAIRRGAANRVTAIIPLYGYARQNAKDPPGPALPLLAKEVEKLMRQRGLTAEDIVVVSPDVGGTKRASGMAKMLCSPLAIFSRQRRRATEKSEVDLVGEVQGKTCVVVDDIADTAETLCQAADKLKAAWVLAGCDLQV
eukprot:g22748.t1